MINIYLTILQQSLCRRERTELMVSFTPLQPVLQSDELGPSMCSWLTPSTGRGLFKIYVNSPSLNLAQSLGSSYRGITITNPHKVSKINIAQN